MVENTRIPFSLQELNFAGCPVTRNLGSLLGGNTKIVRERSENIHALLIRDFSTFLEISYFGQGGFG
jgi:hypothetical protein